MSVQDDLDDLHHQMAMRVKSALGDAVIVRGKD